jgi:tripartite-type tricarboxylate transporter receptor subunit TctC
MIVRFAPRIAGIVLGGALAITITPALAQDYPSRIVRMIVPQAAGGATDVFGRAIGQKLNERWGQPVVIENRVGAGGTLGTAAVAKAAPDGYTLLFTYEGAQAINQTLYQSLTFDSVKDFQTIGTVASVPFYMLVHPKVPANNLAEFIALARQSPGTLTFASAGAGSVNHLLGEMIKSEAGIEITHVPYRGVAQATTDLIGGQVDSAFGSVPGVIQNIRSGQVRAIAVSSAQRVAVTPEVPTFAESGLTGFDVNPWWGMLAPAATDPAIVRKISADVSALLQTKEMQDFFAGQGAQVRMTSSADFQKMLQADIAKWAKVIKASGARAD